MEEQQDEFQHDESIVRRHYRHLAMRELIIGGHDIQKGRYPYFVAIDKNFGGVVVNGVLIAPDMVLTAGHIALNHMDNLTLTVSAWSVLPRNGDSEQLYEPTIIPVEEYIVHPDWDQFAPLYFAHDFMVLKLAEPSTVPPLRMDRRGLASVGDDCTMMGLGWTDPVVLSPAKTVQETTLTIISNEDCEASHDPARNLSYQGLIVPSMLCTVAPPNTTRDGCAWDSGAPLILPGETATDDVLIALGSTGIGCADPFFPGIQARVLTDIDWIDSQVCQFSHNPPSDFNCTRPSSHMIPTGNTNGLMETNVKGDSTTTTTNTIFRNGFIHGFTTTTSGSSISGNSSSNSSFVVMGAAAVGIVLLLSVIMTTRHRRRTDYVQL